MQLPWITWWRERPDLAVNNFPLSHTGTWLAAESMLQMMVLDVERGRKREREGRRESVCVKAGVHSLGAFAQSLPLLSPPEFCVWMRGEGRRGRTGAGLLGSFISWFIGLLSRYICRPATEGAVWGWVARARGVGWRREQALELDTSKFESQMCSLRDLSKLLISLTCLYPLKNQNKIGGGCGSWEYLHFRIVVRIKGTNTGEITLRNARHLVCSL